MQLVAVLNGIQLARLININILVKNNKLKGKILKSFLFTINNSINRLIDLIKRIV